MASSPNDELRVLLALGEECRRNADVDGALGAFTKAAELTEVPAGAVCVALARAFLDAGDPDSARFWAVRTVEGDDDFGVWDAAARLFAPLRPAAGAVKRTAKVAFLGSYTTTYLARLVRLVAASRGIELEMLETGYAQYERELLDPASSLHAFAPDIVVLAVDARATTLPDWSDQPATDVDAEVERWRALWSRAGALGATVVQHSFVVPADAAIAHLDATLPGSRVRMLARCNEHLADGLPANVRIVDCERLASAFGKQAWFDPLWWDRAKLGVSLPATPALARHTVAVVAGHLGLGRKCVVVDLDNTLWGGVVGEDGLAGLKVGGDAAGDGYLAFQDRLLALKRRGVVLAACSKNDDAAAREPFEQLPDMHLRLDDFAAFVANWQSKVDNIKQIAADLSIGLDAIAYVDDNPVERQEVRRFLPDVDVITIPRQPSLYARALAGYPWFETGSYTAEDAHRTEQYRARSQINELERSAGSIDDFYRDLHMAAVISPFIDVDVARIAQLIGKTNQFNLTTRRRGPGELQAIVADDRYVHLSLRLRDRFTDHGLVAVVIAELDGATLDIDTWLMSCRVIGRGVEQAMLAAIARSASDRGCTTLRGTFVPSGKNGLVQDHYPSLGFTLVAERDAATVWERPVAGACENTSFIEIQE